MSACGGLGSSPARPRRLPRRRHGARQDRPGPRLLLWLSRQPRTSPQLLVAPASLLGNWAAEAARFAPRSRFRRHPPRGRSPAAPAAENLRDRSLVTSYGRRAARLDRPDALAARRARRGPGDQEPQRKQTRAVKVLRPQPRRADRHADREQPARPLVDLRFPQPRAARIAEAFADFVKRLAAKDPVSDAPLASWSDPTSFAG